MLAKRGRFAPALFLLLGGGGLALWAQGVASRGVTAAARGKFSGRPWPVTFTDVAARAGLTAPVKYGGVDRIDYLVESSGGGLAAIDFDRDGWLDLFIVDGEGGRHRLYRNQRGGTFKLASERASGWGMGVALGDYDGDGFDDLYVTQ